MVTRLRSCLLAPNKRSLLSPLTIQLGENSISLSVSVKNLGVLLDTLSMNKFISQTSQSSYYQLHLISCIQKYLSAEATAKLVTTDPVPSWWLKCPPFWSFLDKTIQNALTCSHSRTKYTNTNMPTVHTAERSIHCHQHIQNSAARQVLRKKKTDHIFPPCTARQFR